jgi:NADPH2:quinone reductase
VSFRKICYLLPDGLDLQGAVASVHSALTAVIGLQFKVHLTAGETVFVNGGDGSVGNAVVRIAKALGARVAVTSSNEKKRAWIRNAGADLVIDYKNEDVTEKLREFAASGLNVYWDATLTRTQNAPWT